jgi:HTH-type transcriptional regulator / antitoxin HigA
MRTQRGRNSQRPRTGKRCSGNVPNEFALLVWQARVLHLAHRLHEQDAIKPFELNDTRFVDLKRRKDGPRQALTC